MWSNSAATASTTVTPSTTTTYTVTVTNGNLCTASDAVIVTVNPLPIVNAGNDVGICVGQTTILTATGGPSYLWSNGATTAVITVSPVATTTYTVTVTNNFGCAANDVVIVSVNPLPILSIPPQQFVQEIQQHYQL